MRVVSLAASNTEIVCALGHGASLVGVDNHSDHPPDVVAPLPKLGPDLSIDVARVAALKPDLILASMTLPGHERVVEQITSLGIPYIAPDPLSLSDVYRDIRDIGDRLGASVRAERLVEEMQRAMVARPASGLRVLVEWWPKPVIVPGRLSWVSDLCRLSGGLNPWEGEERRSLPITDDDVLRHQPDIVAVSWCGVPLSRYRLDVVFRRPRWSSLPAIEKRQVVPITEAWLGRPGPRLVDGYRALCDVIDASGGHARV